MEHRSHKRHVVETPIKIMMLDMKNQISRTVDISRGGACIHNPGIDLKQGNIVQLDFIDLHIKKRFGQYLRAMVIHTTDKTIGMMFNNEFATPKLIRALLSYNTTDMAEIDTYKQTPKY